MSLNYWFDREGRVRWNRLAGSTDMASTLPLPVSSATKFDVWSEQLDWRILRPCSNSSAVNGLERARNLALPFCARILSTSFQCVCVSPTHHCLPSPLLKALPPSIGNEFPSSAASSSCLVNSFEKTQNSSSTRERKLPPPCSPPTSVAMSRYGSYAQTGWVTPKRRRDF